MLTLNDICALNIEISSRCAAHCRFCSRHQKLRPYGAYDITLNEFKRLPESVLRRLKRISFAGNFGDLCSNKEFTDIAAYLKGINPSLLMEGHSNGALQNRSWWKRLGSLFSGSSSMVFALDGMADTHALYRRGTDFNTIIRHVESFTSGGGTAFWKFILFEHNQHQIQAAEALARDIGCSGFVVITSRDYDTVCRKPKSIDLEIKRDIYYETWQGLAEEDRYANCKPFHAGSIYIAADGTVHPCCFAHCMYITEHNDRFGFIVPLIEKYQEEINFKTRPLKDIIQHPYFETVSRMSGTNDYCVMKCNKYKKDIRQRLVVHERQFR